MTFSETTVSGQKFRIGRAVITRGALAFCEDQGINYLDLVMRHSIGDFGDVGKLTDATLTDDERELGAMMTDNDLKLNLVAVEHAEGLVMSVFTNVKVPESPIWVQTLLAGDETYTTILLPSEY